MTSSLSRCHVFAGAFADRAEATAYSEAAAWDGPPAEEVSQEEYDARMDASWPLRADLDFLYLDGDFIETITGEDRFEYLGTLLTDPSALERIRSSAPRTNTLVLIFEDALGGFEATLRSTPKLVYCGAFEIDFA